MSYHWCLVRECKSSSKKTPKKLWIQVPSNIKMRGIWLNQAGRDPNSVSLKTRLYFCEDHFDLENDMDNYIEYKMMGSVKRVRMKPNCIPSRFDCQTNEKQKSESGMSSQSLIKKHGLSTIEKIKESMEIDNDTTSQTAFSQENFHPATSYRERRKLNRKIYFMNRKNRKIYNESGLIAATGKDLCDCLDQTCPGCHFPCPICNSLKCGHECRCDRKWMYEKIEIEGTDVIIRNVKKKK